MSKLDGLQEWFTLEDASNRISKVLGVPVTLANIYRQTLDGNLTISVNFVNETMARTGKYIPTSEYGNTDGSKMSFLDESCADYFIIPSKETGVVFGELIKLRSHIFPIKGIWDLTMLGAEQIDIKAYYYKEISKIEVTPKILDGIFLKQGDVLCQPQIDLDSNGSQVCSEGHETTEKSYSPSNSLDNHDFIFVIRSREVKRFIQSLEDISEEDKPTEQTAYKKNTDKLEQGKIKTQVKYQKWQDEAVKIKDDDPTKTKSWISAKIAKMAIAENASSETIRKKINI
jgi:hypothetical protein